LGNVVLFTIPQGGEFISNEKQSDILGLMRPRGSESAREEVREGGRTREMTGLLLAREIAKTTNVPEKVMLKPS
jgi:CxxC motif-containing protein